MSENPYVRYLYGFPSAGEIQARRQALQRDLDNCRSVNSPLPVRDAEAEAAVSTLTSLGYRYVGSSWVAPLPSANNTHYAGSPEFESAVGRMVAERELRYIVSGGDIYL